MNKKFSLKQFLSKYPNDEACLHEIFKKRYPHGVDCSTCKRVTKYYKIKGRKAYSCEFCRTQIHPLVNTIFEKSSISLQLWFYAMFIMVKTRSGISSKQLERELGVCYKTAHRMFKQIRKLMANDDNSLLEGTVEIDETFVGGKGMNRMRKDYSEKPKEVVMGMVERGGRLRAQHIQNTGRWSLLEQIQKHVSPTARIMTDEYRGYWQLRKLGYNHYRVNHKKHFAVGDVYTQNAENVWSHLKRGLFGVYRHVSPEYLQNYVDEYSWRYNNRKLGEGMFEKLLSVASVGVAKHA